ncbi:MAG: type I DNA topoisomerase [Candidatus Staskawiczbacteria bacterium]|nr:type I DNA topoisomerase [Candidatus Staskawiczbacteria bacterium]
MELVIVESPTKAKTIQKFLGKKYKILSSFGHVRDLPKSELGVDVEKDFEPKYIIPTKARKNVTLLKKEAAKADEVILATDEDREGEAISWHLEEALKLKNPKRIVFHEITEDAIKEALENPRKIDKRLVDAQQARRILDRIVGYKLSPFLWKKISRGLSAGRVQSIAVRLVVEKEREIEKFKPVEYWSVEAILNKSGIDFSAFLSKVNGKSIDKLEIKNKEEANKILNELKGSEYKVESVEKKETKRNPLSPFTTSTLQQTSANKLGYSSKYTMSLAQKLYEEGHITYHRTDSLNLSQLSLNSAQKFIEESFGKNYYNFRKFKAKSGAQEAHEAIRPTFANKTPESLKGELDGPKYKLYTLIWQRFIACQMSPALFDSTSVDILANQYTFSANGQVLKFDGFLKVYPMKFSENDMPKLEEKELLSLVKIDPLQHFTEPPARYNEASLIKALEKHGIGRPSTYAPTLSTVQERNYISKNEQKRFIPSEMGIMVNDMLVENFPQIVDIDFTAKMEKELDEIAEGKDTWKKTIKDFYEPFSKNLQEKYDDVKKENTDIKTDKVCPKCSKPMVEKLGRFGRFYACTGFPDCKHTESLVKDGPGNQIIKLDIICPKCKQGNMVAKKTKRGKIFYGCDKYPACDMATWDKPINEFCPTCNSILVENKKGQVKCSNKECNHKREQSNADSNSKANKE